MRTRVLALRQTSLSLNCAGAWVSVKVAVKRNWYHVTLPCGVVIQVNPAAKFGAVDVNGIMEAISRKASDAVEEIAGNPRSPLRKDVLRYALRAEASTEEMGWACQKLGLAQYGRGSGRVKGGIVAQAREMVA